jgi:polygalacturonase
MSKARDNVLKLNAVVNVTDFGAKGDGTTDDTAALQAAANALTSNGSLMFSRGHYIVSNDIVFTSLQNINVYSQGAKITQTGTAKKTLRFVSCIGVEVSGFHLVGKGTEFNGISTSFNGVSGIFFEACEDVFVHHNKLTNHAGGGIRWTTSARRFVITENRVQGIGAAGGIASLDNGNDVCIGSWVTPNESKDINISYNALSDTAFGIFIANGSNYVCVGNAIRSIPGQHGFYLTAQNNVSIVNNVLEDVEAIGIKLQVADNNVNVENLTVSGNTIRNAGQTGIAFEHTGVTNASFKNAVISSNAIYNSLTQSGIIVMNTTGVLITGNVIGKMGQYGIDLRASTGVISNNLIENTNANGIILISPTGDTFVQHNIVRNAVLNPNNTVNDDFNFYFRVNDAIAACNVYLTKNTFQQTGTVPTQFAASGLVWSTGANVNVYADDNNNLTTKNWNAASAANLKLANFGFSRNVGANASAQASPSTPVYGFGRRELHGTQSPQEAAMTDTFFEGDICWHADPENRFLGWVCTSAGAPGTWSIIGAQQTASATSIANIGNAINTTDKFAGKLVWDTTNNRMVRANGATAADVWHVIDGSATVTPS